VTQFLLAAEVTLGRPEPMRGPVGIGFARALRRLNDRTWRCHVSGGELEQIQFLLGHVSVQTTERYLGCKQKIRDAVNDRIGVEPAN
jgi:integrase